MRSTTNRRFLVASFLAIFYGTIAYSFGVFLFFWGLFFLVVWAAEVLNV